MIRYRKPSFWTKIKLLFYRTKYKKNKKRGLIKKFLVLILWGFIISSIGILCVFAYYSKDLPSPDKISQREVVQSTKIYDRTGEVLLYDIHGEEKRTVINFQDIPQYMKDATIVAEDDSFYHHFGLDFKGIIRAFFSNLRGRKITQGGSTITQQFIKNAILSPERTLTRKIKEAILAIEMEIKYSKDEILGFYLNQVPYGSNAYGVEAAAMTFFNKHAKDLSLAESALLAALPKAPSYYSPFGSHPEELKARQEWILDRMVKFGYITQEQAEKAKKEKLTFATQSKGIKAPHFVMYVKEYLEEKYGRDFIERGGLKVYTTLDWDLQFLAEEIVAEFAEKNKKNFRAYNASLVAIDPKTGQILAMVGSKDYFGDPEPKGCISGKNCFFDPKVNIAIRPRQPGSSFKPFVYAAAFKKGFTPDTIVFDLKTEFATFGAPSYIPQNYDGKFRGPVTLRQALAQSLNIPSVKVLYLAGINESINLAEDLGITTLKDRSRYGLSLVLGGGEVTLLEQTAAFSVFATEGQKHPIVSILKIEDGKGNILEEYKDKSIRVLEPQIARLISDILSDEESRKPMFGDKSKLYIEGIEAAAKTGTTQEYRDGWTIGYTPSLTVGVWAGNNYPESMRNGAGIYVAAPIWNKFIKKAYEKKQELKKNENQKNENYFDLPSEPEKFNKPQPIKTNKDILNGKFAHEIKVKIDKLTGKLATEYTPLELIEERVYKEVHCILYYIDKDDPQGEGNGRNDPQFNNWEPPVLKWAYLQNEKYGTNYNTHLPQEYDDIHTEENQPRIDIISPKNSEIIKSKNIEINVSVKAPLGVKQVDFFFDDNLIGTDKTKPYKIIYQLPYNIKGRRHTITARVYDKYGSRQEDKIEIILEIKGIEDVEEIKNAELSLISNEYPYKFKISLKDENNNLIWKKIKRIDIYYFTKEDMDKYLFATSSYYSDIQSEYEISWKQKIRPGNYFIFANLIDNDNNVIETNTIDVYLK